MVAGHLQEKNGVYYAVLSYRDATGKRKQPWINTGLPVKGNKKKPKRSWMSFGKSMRYRSATPASCAAPCSLPTTWSIG